MINQVADIEFFFMGSIILSLTLGPLVICLVYYIFRFRLFTRLYLPFLGALLVMAWSVMGMVMVNFEIFLTLIILSLNTIITMTLFYFFQYRQVVHSLKQTSEFALNIANKNLAFEIKSELSKRSDEIGDLNRAVNQMVKNLKEMINLIQNSTDQVAAASQELASTSEEVNALTEEVVATIQHVSKSASIQSNSAQQGINNVLEFTSTVDMSMKSIRETIKVIDQISDQTNILALNASIEAARSGEYGRGFAVVADNVRRLAEETQSNSVEITRIVNEVIENISRSLNYISETFQNFAAQSEEFSASSEEVAASTEEQTAAINQITTSSQELALLSEKLSELANQYTI